MLSKSCSFTLLTNAVPDNVNVEEVLAYSLWPAVQMSLAILHIQIPSLEVEIWECTNFRGTFCYRKVFTNVPIPL
jgi:hypothetical protein